MRQLFSGLMACLLLASAAPVAFGAVVSPPVTVWITPDPENILVIDSTKGRIFVELHPEMAPKAVERIKFLARRGTYDGLQFWRVIAGFVAQSGDPGNHDGGKTELPNLAPEFTFTLEPSRRAVAVARPSGLQEGFLGAMPYVAGVPLKPGPARAWGTYCAGVMGMGRDAPPDSANAEIFFMLAATPRLDRDYTAVGRVIVGEAVLGRLKAGEPATDADVMRHVRVLADVPQAPVLQVMDTHSRQFRRIVARLRRQKGADFSVCDIDVPARIKP